MVSLLAERGGLLLPVVCAGCGRPDVPWCDRCARSLDLVPQRCEQRAGRLDLLDGRAPPPVWCVAPMAGPLRSAVTAWKDGGRCDLGRRFARAVRAVVTDPVVGAHLVGLALAGDLVVVGVPTTPGARRRRGGDPVAELVIAVGQGLAASGLGGRVLPALHRRPSGDLARAGARERATQVRAAVQVRRRSLGDLDGAQIVLVDDVLTTGATFAACRQALNGAGARLAAGVVLASTPAPDEPRTSRSPVRRVDRGRSGG